jgi:hypothetical protein
MVEELKGVTVLWSVEGGGEGFCMEAILTLEGNGTWAQQTQGGTRAFICFFIISTGTMTQPNLSHKMLYVILTRDSSLFVP